MTILLVDDDSLTLEALQRLLERAGHGVIAFQAGGEALDWLSAHTPDAIILDIVMPRLSGYDVCRRLRQIPHVRRAPVVFLTSKDREGDMREAREAGSDLFVTKPVLAARLLKLLSDVRPPLPAGGAP